MRKAFSNGSVRLLPAIVSVGGRRASKADGRHYRSAAFLTTLGLLASLTLGLPATASAQVYSYPDSMHYDAYRVLYLDGDFVEARQSFSRTPRRKSSEGVWIDSIAYHAMIGECLYQMGDLAEALQQYTLALQTYSQYSDWLLRVNLPDTLQPSTRAGRRAPNWGTTSRVVRVASIPDMIGVRMGNSDSANNAVLRQGGVFRSRYVMRVDAKELVRCMALALRRRAEILGPCGQFDNFTNDLITKLSRRPAPPGSWAQAWVGVHLGLAYMTKGNLDDAQTELQNSLLVAGMDHNLTSTAFLELGKIAFHAEEYATALSYFQEAAQSAAMMVDEEISQNEVLAEAFRWSVVCHQITAPGTLYPPISQALEWARRRDRMVEIDLLLSAADNCAGIKDPAGARGFLERAAKEMSRRECARGELGGRHQYLTALIAFQMGDTSRGTASLTTALKYQEKASRRVFQIRLADKAYTSGTLTTRQSGLLYDVVLRDPTHHDWLHDPLESLAVLTFPHTRSYENRMAIALERKEYDSVLRISEYLRRHQFFTSLPLGGRLLNLRWTLSAPEQTLPQDIILKRQDLLNRFPLMREQLSAIGRLRSELVKLPVDAEEPAVQNRIADLQRQMGDLSGAVERQLDAIALSREPSDIVFPPTTDVLRVQQEKLSPDQRILVYVAIGKATYAFLLGDEKYSTWTIESPATVRDDVTQMLREMGQYNRNQQLGLKELTSDAWKSTSADILKTLTGNAPPEAWDEFKELIVVPIGMLWYVPFETLQIENGGEYVAVIDKVRVRYAPTISLAVPDARPRTRLARTAVVTGMLYSRDGDILTEELLEDLKADDPNVYGVPVKPAPNGPMLAKTIDRLIVLSDLTNDAAGPYDWSPMAIERGKGAASLGSWMQLPWGGPDEVVLPGFHTAAETGLKRAGNGDELFLTACGMLATGSRTVLLSRWRDGGQTSLDLIREFVRELPHRSASEAWQRSVRLAVSRDLAWSQEPRIKDVPPETPPMKAKHPFFWGGYMLIDTGVRPSFD